MTRKLGWMLPLCMSAVVGCGARDGGDAGWVRASDALAQHGVAQYRATTTATGQDVLLRDGDAQTIGELSLVQAEGTTTVSLEFRADVWKEIVAAADGKMTLSLDGREATLSWAAGAWTGDGAAEALLADSQPYADFVRGGISDENGGCSGVSTMLASAPLSDGGSLAFADSNIARLDGSGAMLWTVPSPFGHISAASADRDGFLYLARGPQVARLALADGSVAWLSELR